MTPAPGTNVITYARDASAIPGATMATPELLLRRCDERGYLIVGSYGDPPDTSDPDNSRVGLETAIRALSEHDARALVLVRIDDAADTLRSLATLLDELAELDCSLESIEEGIDSSTPSGAVAMRLVKKVARWERERVSASARAGLAAARKRGVRVGRPPARWAQNTNGTAEIDEHGIVARAASLRAQGLPLARIAEIFNDEGIPTSTGKGRWHKTTVARLTDNATLDD